MSAVPARIAGIAIPAIAPTGVTSSEASPRLTLVGGPDEVEATEARCEIRVLIADGQALLQAGFRVPTELVRAVDAPARGEALLAPRLARRLMAELASRPHPEAPKPGAARCADAREREVSACIA